MREKCNCEVLEGLINSMKESAPLLCTVDRYLRKRSRNGKHCPGRMAYLQYKKNMDKELAVAIAKYAKLKSEGHEQD